jgi:hypothetical protein
MRHSTRLTLLALALATPAVVAGTSSLAHAEARAELQPSHELAVDSPARLVITSDAGDVRPPRFDIDNARVQFNGQANRTIVSNGQLSRETVFMYTVTPQRTGELDIPAIAVGQDHTAPLHASVAARASASARSAPVVHVDDKARAFVRIDAPKRAMYVGEAVPIRIRAYFRSGVAAALQGAPHLTSPAFTLDRLSDKPEQKQIEIDGVPYLQATWTAVLSAAKPTTDKLTVELPVQISYRESRPAPQRRSLRDLFGADPFSDDTSMFGNDPFASSFFDDDPFAGFDTMFDIGDLRQQELTLRNTAAGARIAELPEKGQSDSFGGAVGDFDLAVEMPKEPLRVGEPATLVFRVSGAGNFDHVAITGIEGSTDWKVYPGKSDMAWDNDGGTSGTKTITQTIVPARAGSLEIPSVALEYFDPKRGTYRTVHTDAAQVDVSPAMAGAAANAMGSAPHDKLASGDAPPSRSHSTLQPLLYQSSFWMYPGLLAVLTALQLAIAWGRRSEWVRDRWRKRRLSRRVALEQHKAGLAARDGDAPAFFEASRRALQLVLAERWDVRPETITADDVERRLGSDSMPIREVFERADHIKYTRNEDVHESFDTWRTVVTTQLKKWEVSR